MNNNVNTLDFESILRLKQKDLKNALAVELEQMGYPVQSQKGYLYAKGNVPVMLVAHMDTVHKQPVRTICYSQDGNIVMSPEGIGGDDRAGVYMILQIIRNQRCHVLFCEDEETGAHGARAFASAKLQPEVNYIIELDRMGSNDAVFYGCHNPEFTEFILGFGFSKESGSFSDISVIAPKLKIAAVNISTGYYNAHCRHECINLAHVQRNIERIGEMVQTKTQRFEYIERKWERDYFELLEDADDRGFEQMTIGKQSTLWRMEGFGTGRTKDLMPLPDSAVLEMTGKLLGEIDNEYYMDADGNIYDYLLDIDAAVRSEGAVAYTDDGYLLKFDADNSKKMKVVSLEQAIDMLNAA